MFVHLRAQSYYSLLRGVASPEALVQAAVSNRMQALALTDHVNMTGAIEFYQACLESGIQPILGLEVPVFPPGQLAAAVRGGLQQEQTDTRELEVISPDPLVLLAMDMAGWRSLCRLSSAVQMKPVNPNGNILPFEELLQKNAGLICLCGGKRGLITAALRKGMDGFSKRYVDQLQAVFADRLYIALENPGPGDGALAAQLAAMADKFSIPVVATQDVHYVNPEDGKIQSLVTAMRLNRPVTGLPDRELAPPRSHFATQQEMVDWFPNNPAAIEATVEIAARCQLTLPLGEPHFPEISLSDGLTAMEVLQQKAEKGAVRRYGEITPEIRNRLDHELEVIAQSGYAVIFLVMEEVIQYARDSSIPVSSRGSAASSLVAHCLGITDPDPLALNLYFERFLNPARSSPPDIDTDLCSRRRDEVIDFVYKRFGDERVAMVCTINRFRKRSALREVAKAYGLASEQIKELVDRIPRRGWGPPNRLTPQERPYAVLAESFGTSLHQEIFSNAEALLGTPRHLSIHPGGIVIAPGLITDLVPIQMSSKGVAITQFDLESIEQMGLVKIDLLGIRGLSVLNDVGEAIYGLVQKGNYSAEGKIFTPAMGAATSSLGILEAIPEEDPQTAQTVQEGRTIGCFQIESPGMRATLKEIQATSRDDIMIVLALYRPGPLTGGLKDAFVNRHLGLEEVAHLDPALEPLLKDTYGVILYQEQVLRIAHELAGLSLADADLLRRAMSHFDPGKQMQTLRERFIAGAYQRSGVPEEVGDRVWELMAAFAGYGFPKAHAASYAQVAWRSAWCKTHHPAVFMAAVLANWGGYYRQSVYLTEARRMGLSVRPPDVSFAQREFSLSYFNAEPVLFMGLDQVRDLTRRTQKRIIRLRPFSSFTDFLTRVDPRSIEAENLVKSGALPGWGTIPQLLSQLDAGGWLRGQLPLFGMSVLEGEAGSVQEGDWSLDEKVAAQKAILGAGLAAHPLELVKESIIKAGALSTVEAVTRIGERVRVAGMRQTWRRGSTSKGERLYIMGLEDLEGLLNVIIYDDVHQRSRREISGSGPYIVEGYVEVDQRTGEPYLRAERIWRL